jgi:hypothetical protein
MRRLAAALCGLGAAALASAASAADFHLFRVVGETASVVDFDAVSEPAPGFRRVPFEIAMEQPVRQPAGAALYSTIVYRYDCEKPSVRADTLIFYDADFHVLAQEPRPSPWRRIHDVDHLPEDFQRFCSNNPHMGDVGERLPAGDWKAALEMARARLGW